MLPYGFGGILVLVGVVWFLQGIGLLKGSFMTGSAFWAVTGAVCLVAGVVMVTVNRRRAGGGPNPP